MANLSNINNKFLVTTTGEVLVGRTAATGTSKLQVSGSLLVGTDINSGIPLVVQETTAAGFAIGFMRNTNATNGNGLVIDVNSTGGAYIQDWRQASTVKMRLLQNGNLGIGTDSPTSKLHLRDPGVNSDVGIKIGNDSRDWNLKVMGSVSDSFQIFTHDNSNVMTILPSGNVGIGVTPSAIWSSSYNALQIGLGGSVYAHSSAGSSLNLGANIVYEGTAPNYYDKYLTSSTATKYQQDAGVHIWSTAVSGTAGNAVSWSERMRITNGGQVQVGYYNTARGGANTTFMTGKSGTTYLELNGGDTSGEGGILFADGSGGNYGLINYSHVSDLMQFYTASAERMRISSNGRTLITVASGNTIQDTTLQLKATGASDNAGIMFINTGNTSSFNDIAGIASFVESGSAKGNLQFWTRNTDGANTDVATRLTINSSGTVGIGTISPQAQLHINEDASNSYATLRLEGANRGGIIEMYNQTSYPVSSWTTDQSGNIFFATSGAFAATSLSTKFTILTGGNVGIGTTSPSQLLHVNSSTNNPTGIGLQNSERYYAVRSNNYSLVFSDETVGLERMRIDNSGNIGVGVTPESWGTSGDTKVIRISTMSSVSEAFTGLQLASNFYFDGNNDKYILSDFASSLLQIDGEFRFRNASSGTAGNNISWNERLRIDSSGNIGINGESNFGSSNKAVQLINGVYSGAFQIDSIGNIGLAQNAYQDGTWKYYQTNEAAILNLEDGEFKFFNAASGTADTGISFTERMRISSTGNVGIGTTSPNDKLEVSGGNIRIYSTNNANHLIIKNNATGTSGVFEERIKFLGWNDNENAAIIAMGNAYFGQPVNVLAFQVSGSEKMRITHGGDLYVGTTSTNPINGFRVLQADGGTFIQIEHPVNTSSGSDYAIFRYNQSIIGTIRQNGTSQVQYNVSSDYRLKEDLQDFAGLELVSKIPVYDYKWKSSEDRSYGVMAHELQEVLPDAVSGEKDAEEMQGVDYSKIVPLLVKAIQELEAKIKILENK